MASHNPFFLLSFCYFLALKLKRNLINGDLSPFLASSLSFLCNSSTSYFSPFFLYFSPQNSPMKLQNFTRNLINGGFSQTPSPSVRLGDSSVDCGTNNYLSTFAHRPTGMFSNGGITFDYQDLRLGLSLVLVYLAQGGSVQEMKHELNYVSAGAAIIFTSASELGQHISFTQQIQQLIIGLGDEAAIDMITKPVFYLSIGSNDYIHYYLRNVSRVQGLNLPRGFDHLFVTTVKQELKNLYNADVRRMVVMGMASIGCAPRYLWQYSTRDGECVKEINDMVMEFNFALRFMVEELIDELPDYAITFCDTFKASMDIMKNRQQYGFEVTTDACCGFGQYNGWLMCSSSEMACNNASNHVWWDQFHPTEAVNSILADNVWSGQHMNMCYPMNLREMVVAPVSVIRPD